MHDPVFALAQQREGRLRILAVSTGNALAGDARHADHDRARRPDGPDRLVGRDGAGRHAEAGRRPDQQVVQRRSWRPTRPRRSSTSSAATRTSTRPKRARRCSSRDQGLGRLRAARQDRAAGERPLRNAGQERDDASSQTRQLIPACGRRARACRRRCGAAGRSAQDYPSQDIHLICGFPAGSGADVIVRYFAEKLRPLAGPHRHRREQGRRATRQHRDRIRRARQARRLHDLSIRRHHASPPACICSRTRRSTSARRCRSPPPPAISPSCSWSTPRARTRPSPS